MKGLELEVDFAVSDTVTIDGSYSYLDFEWQTIAAGASVLPSGITPFTPETTWSMGIQYMNATQSGTMFARLDAAYQDDMWTDAENSHETLIESRTLLNASMSWTTPDEKWKAKLEVKNLTDKEYFGYIQAGHGLGVGYAAPALPRTYMVTLRREFF
jgi:iron complex outermembrane receptor protein